MGAGGAPARRGLKRSNQRHADGKPAANDEQYANCDVSRARRLCSIVVPVRGCPRMKTGLELMRCLAMARPYTSISTIPRHELSTWPCGW